LFKDIFPQVITFNLIPLILFFPPPWRGAGEDAGEGVGRRETLGTRLDNNLSTQL